MSVCLRQDSAQKRRLGSEVEQESDFIRGGFQVVEQLLLVRLGQLQVGFDFNQDSPFDKKVDAIAADFLAAARSSLNTVSLGAPLRINRAHTHPELLSAKCAETREVREKDNDQTTPRLSRFFACFAMSSSGY